MARAIVDQVLKEMTEHHPRQFLKLLFKQEKFRVLSTKLDKELTVKTRITDRVMRLLTKRGERLLHLEFQLRYGRKIPERLFVYAGALTAKYEIPVASILVLIKPTRRIGDRGVYVSDIFDEDANTFSFPVIHLWKFREAILSGNKDFRVFAPLLLEIEPKPKPELLRRVRDLINLEADAQRRAEFLSFAIPIARRHFGLSLIQDIFKETDMINVEWEKIPHFGDALRAKTIAASAKAREEGLHSGREEGMREGHEAGEIFASQEMLAELLRIQFGAVPVRTMRAIHAIHDRRVLKAMTRKILKADSLAEVHKLLVANKAKTNGRNGSSAHRPRYAR